MRIYIIHRRRGASIQITAHGYTEDKRAKRVYFHKRSDRSDRDCFCFLSEIAAIDVHDEPGKIEHLDIHADFDKFLSTLRSEAETKNT